MSSNHNWLGATAFLIFWMAMSSLTAGGPDEVETESLVQQDLNEAVAQAQASDKKNDFQTNF